MSVTAWFRRLFSPATTDSADAASEPEPLGMAGGVTPLMGLEDSAAVENVEKETEPPSDPV